MAFAYATERAAFERDAHLEVRTVILNPSKHNHMLFQPRIAYESKKKQLQKLFFLHLMPIKGFGGLGPQKTEGWHEILVKGRSRRSRRRTKPIIIIIKKKMTKKKRLYLTPMDNHIK